uniref:WAP domain-containing protein n=1 Tax=Macrostomum lignano TaxID=282301 RepID=A0A1I8F9E8_9PLAT
MKNLPLLLQQFSVIVLLINGLVLQQSSSGAKLVRPDIRVTSPCLSNEERVYFQTKCQGLPELAKPIKSRDGRCPMRISVWIECSPGFYGRGCDVRCEPQRGCCCDSRVCCDAMKQLLATKPAFPTSGPGARGSSNGNSDNRNRDEATLSVSSVDADSTVLNLRRQQNHYQLQHQNLGYFNPASYNTLTSQVTNLSTIVSTSAVPANNRTDSGVYEDPQEPPAGDPSETPPPPPPPPRPLQSRQSEDIQRMPQSKSYSRKAAAKE